MILRLKKLFLLVTLSTLTFSCGKKVEQAFSFVQLCDPQLGMGGYEHDKETFAQAVEQINELNPDFVVICGDLVHSPNDSSYKDFQEIMSGFTVPCHLAPGNHDIRKVPTAQTIAYYRNKIGKDYYHFKNKDHLFIITNTQYWKCDVENESKLHNEWFEKTIKRKKSKRHSTFVIGHYPLYTESPDEKEHNFNLPEPHRKQILQLLKDNNAAAYLSGHTHKLTINNYEDIELVSGETTSKNFDKRPFGYRVWTVDQNAVEHHFVPLKEIRKIQ
ncbi:metallophosphoesterase [Flammeovirga agarivorans]|uniref:Calcineurin-like phosphoesterase domain-containing protein n=1 Tax=Flammeovirga agarivorans TaxID=2726742 RepID=A0A7X8XVK5_9BACT|nr:metallophosphoesterase [Flammeovirga agarivorans]NLR91427.1 hypothetical protein [Flammeovirga agarivorans]